MAVMDIFCFLLAKLKKIFSLYLEHSTFYGAISNHVSDIGSWEHLFLISFSPMSEFNKSARNKIGRICAKKKLVVFINGEEN
jgi:hypothetical protein